MTVALFGGGGFFFKSGNGINGIMDGHTRIYTHRHTLIGAGYTPFVQFRHMLHVILCSRRHISDVNVIVLFYLFSSNFATFFWKCLKGLQQK
jgi:hypothetical protein